MYVIFYSSSNDDHKELYVSDDDRILFNLNEAVRIAESFEKKGCVLCLVEVSIDD